MYRILTLLIDIVLGTLICSEVVGESCSIHANFQALNHVEVVDHVVVEWEHQHVVRFVVINSCLPVVGQEHGE
jgi:hypothetical protein